MGCGVSMNVQASPAAQSVCVAGVRAVGVRGPALWVLSAALLCSANAAFAQKFEIASATSDPRALFMPTQAAGRCLAGRIGGPHARGIARAGG